MLVNNIVFGHLDKSFHPCLSLTIVLKCVFLFIFVCHEPFIIFAPDSYVVLFLQCYSADIWS